MSPRWWLLTRLLALQSVMDGRQQHGRSSRADQLEPLPPKLTRLKPPGSIALPSCPPGNAAPVAAPPAPSNQEDRPPSTVSAPTCGPISHWLRLADFAGH